MVYKDREKRLAYGRKYRAANPEYARGYRAEIKQFLDEQLALMGPCAHCGTYDNPRFHHIDPTTKNFTIGSYSVSDKAILLAEISLCIRLCHSCHMTEHARMRREDRSTS